MTDVAVDSKPSRFATTVTPVDANSKVVADGFSETYHIQGLHREMLASIDDVHAHRTLDAERGFLAELGGDCDLPAGAHATVRPDGGLRLEAMLASLDGKLQRQMARRGVRKTVPTAGANFSSCTVPCLPTLSWQMKSIAPLPKLTRALLMRRRNQIPAGFRSQVANHRGLN